MCLSGPVRQSEIVCIPDLLRMADESLIFGGIWLGSLGEGASSVALFIVSVFFNLVPGK